MHRNFPFSFRPADAVPWSTLDMAAIATLLVSDFQNGLSREEAAARLDVVRRGRSGWQRLWSAVGTLFRFERGRRGVRVIRDGRLLRVPRAYIVPGDVIELACGEQAPSDGRVIRAYELAWKEGRISHAADMQGSPAPGILLRKGALILSGRARIVAVRH